MRLLDNANPNRVVVAMQIINISLILGIAAFLGVALLITKGQQPKEPKVTYLALGFLAVSVLVYSVLRLPINRHRVKQIVQDFSFDRDSDELFMALAPTYQTERIIRLAFIEGGAFFNGVVYMMERVWWCLAAMGVAILLMLVGFPTRSQINAWMERRTLGLQFGASEL